MKYSNYVKKILFEEINKLNENRNEFLKNPGKDFSKIRKLDFSTMLKIILSMETDSLKDELFRYFDFLPSTASVSAFVQQRSKILFTAFESLFHSFNKLSVLIESSLLYQYLNTRLAKTLRFAFGSSCFWYRSYNSLFFRLFKFHMCVFFF